MNIRRFPNALKNSRRCRGVLDVFVAKNGKRNFQFTLNQDMRSIGDERENYFFIRIGGIAFSDKKDIFVLDRTTFSIVKYDWNGVFISRTGQRGRGPGDFLTPSGIQCVNNKLYIYDWLNRRIAVTDLQMKDFDYIKINDLKDHDQRKYSMRIAPIVFGENQFLGINQQYSQEKGRLFVFDKSQRVNKYFFCELPTDLEEEMWRIKGGEEKRFLFNFFTYPHVAVSSQKKQMLLSFEYPDEDMHFYLYTLSGELIRKTSHRLDEKFRFPMQQLDGLSNTPRHSTWVLDILSCNNYYLVFMLQTTNRKRPDKKKEFSYLIIDEQGEVKHRVESKIRFIMATPDGYLGGITFDYEKDLLKVVIYKLNLD
jgi:hypothetical protein